MIHKMVHNILNITAAKSYVPYQELENKQMLVGLLDDPNSFVNHVRRYTNSLTTQMVFGFRTTDIHDPKLEALFSVSLILWCHFPRGSSQLINNPVTGVRALLRGNQHRGRRSY